MRPFERPKADITLDKPFRGVKRYGVASIAATSGAIVLGWEQGSGRLTAGHKLP
jgi:hypothetical protein